MLVTRWYVVANNDLGPPWPSSPLWRHEGPDAAVLSVPRVWSSKKSLQYSLDRSSVQFATQWWTAYNSKLETDQMQMFEIWVSHVFSPKSSMVFSAPIHPPVTKTIPAPMVFFCQGAFRVGKVPLVGAFLQGRLTPHTGCGRCRYYPTWLWLT